MCLNIKTLNSVTVETIGQMTDVMTKDFIRFYAHSKVMSIISRKLSEICIENFGNNEWHHFVQCM